MMHMETTTQIYSRKLLNTLVAMFESCPMVESSAHVIFATACEVAYRLIPEGEENTTVVQVPTPAAKVIVRGIIMMSFLSDQMGQSDVKQLLLDIAFQSNDKFALQIMKDMKAIVDDPSEKFSVRTMLTSEPKDRRFELN